MRPELQQVLRLQPSWSSARSPEMDERGLLVREQIPSLLVAHQRAIASALGIPVGDLLIEGSDGAGSKSRVPWVRVSSGTLSPSATNGFYAVYLFAADGHAVFLSLNQGTTDQFKRKDERVIRARAQWGREVTVGWRSRQPGLAVLALRDRPGGLGGGYELGDIGSVRYLAEALPDEDTLVTDLLAFARALGEIYAAQRRMPLPFESPEVELVVETAEVAAGKAPRANGAGFRTDAEEIKVVERHAIARARAHYEQLGWRVRELGKPFDLELRRNGIRLDVEVKGTTSDGMVVTLTDGEVRHHARAYPSNALVVVSRIELDRDVSPPRASGGELREIQPWRIESSDLRPIAHRYLVPPPEAAR